MGLPQLEKSMATKCPQLEKPLAAYSLPVFFTIRSNSRRGKRDSHWLKRLLYLFMSVLRPPWLNLKKYIVLNEVGVFLKFILDKCVAT